MIISEKYNKQDRNSDGSATGTRAVQVGVTNVRNYYIIFGGCQYFIHTSQIITHNYYHILCCTNYCWSAYGYIFTGHVTIYQHSHLTRCIILCESLWHTSRLHTNNIIPVIWKIDWNPNPNRPTLRTSSSLLLWFILPSECQSLFLNTASFQA